MTLTVNGNALTTEAQTLADFFAQKQLETQHSIVELNHEIVLKTADFAHIILHEGDELNILHIVGGG